LVLILHPISCNEFTLLKVTIGNNVVWGQELKLLLVVMVILLIGSLNRMIEAEDYAWIAKKFVFTFLLAKLGMWSCMRSWSFSSENLEAMSVVSGNPAEHIKFQKAAVNFLLVVDPLWEEVFLRHIQQNLE
jgi:hypothetical protein